MQQVLVSLICYGDIMSNYYYAENVFKRYFIHHMTTFYARYHYHYIKYQITIVSDMGA